MKTTLVLTTCFLALGCDSAGDARRPGPDREFERPEFMDGVPDYTPEAMARQQRELRAWKDHLWAFDIEDWPVEQQIDWHLVRAEMNGLDFDHKLRRPWTRDPAFYVMMYPAQSDVPAHEGPVIHGWIDPWTYDHPLGDDDAAELAGRFGTRRVTSTGGAVPTGRCRGPLL